MHDKAEAAAALQSLQAFSQKACKTAPLISPPNTPQKTVTHTHTQKYTKATQKRDDCSQCATGLAVLFENLGALGLILAPRHPLCLPQPASLQGCPCVALLLFHTHTHAKHFIPLSEKEGFALCSNSLM